MSLLLWQQRPDIGPTAQRGAAMTYVASTGKTLLWGGLGDEGSSKEAWEFEGDCWVQVGEYRPEANRWRGYTFGAFSHLSCE
jgi:hypothetical protein